MMRFATHLKRFWRSRTASVLTATAMATPVAVGFVALGVESALWYTERASLQNAADAAALAGAHELRAGKSTAVISQVAIQEAQRNGHIATDYADVVNVPPQSGSYTKSNAVEAILTRPVKLLFAAYFVDGLKKIEARAVAVVNEAGHACILALDSSASDAIQFTGNTDVVVKDCVIAANSSSSSAVTVSGSAAVEVDCINTVGGVSADSGLKLTQCAKALTGAAATTDPLASLAAPATPTSCTHQNFKVTGNPNQSVTMSPGRYCGGMSLQSGAITMHSGTYIIDGGDFEIRANAKVTGIGVTIVLLNAASTDPKITLNGGADIKLTAPTSGDYAGILFFQERGSSGSPNTFNGNAQTDLTGMLYLPSTTLRFLGNNTSAGGCIHIIANTIEFRGNAGIGNDCTGTGTPSIALSGTVRLVE